VDCGARALLGGDHEGAADVDEQLEPATRVAVSREAALHRAGVHGVGRHAAAVQPARQLAREEDVGELRSRVDAHGRYQGEPCVGAFGLEIVEVEAGELVRIGGDVHYPCRCARAQALLEQAGEQVAGQVVHREGGLEAVRRELAPQVHHARVVDEHVQLAVAGEEACARLRTPASDERSARSTLTRSLSLVRRTSSTAARPLSTSRAVMTTVAPRRARPRAVSRPSPGVRAGDEADPVLHGPATILHREKELAPQTSKPRARKGRASSSGSGATSTRGSPLSGCVEREPLGVEAEPRQAPFCAKVAVDAAVAVGHVADDRVGQVLEVAADLVEPSRCGASPRSGCSARDR
jgi:hypothetical protein